MLTLQDLGRRRQVTLLHLVPTALHWAQGNRSNATQLGKWRANYSAPWRGTLCGKHTVGHSCCHN